jgi:hypothetical protein
MSHKVFMIGAVLLMVAGTVSAQMPANNPTIIFWEDGFPATDTASVTRAELAAALPSAAFVGAQVLPQALGQSSTRLLVLPFGSSFPEENWPAIYEFLQRGGNLLALGGRPFMRAAYREACSPQPCTSPWKLRPERNAFARKLFINDYTETPGSRGLELQPGYNYPQAGIPRFEWQRAWSLTVKLSAEDMYPRDGSAGTMDARLDTLVWGVTGEFDDTRRIAAPVVAIDHLQNNFAGGRWVLLACDLPAGFFSSAAGQKLAGSLAQHALKGAAEFTVQPRWALFLSGEPLGFTIRWNRFGAAPEPARVELTISADGQPQTTKVVEIAPTQFPYTTTIDLPESSGKGLQTVVARLLVGDSVQAVYRTGFWMRDLAYLQSGPRVTVNQDFFEVDGRPLLVVGTTYMASDVQRQFFMRPNPYVWDRDFAEMRRNGTNMLRTGWWSAWDQVMKDGVEHESAWRAVEAFLMAARKHQMPVQFNIFAFIPEVLGGKNPYLDPEAIRRQQALVLALLARFKDVPFLVWDLINEPSFDNPNRLWATRANNDPFEARAWQAWLSQQYPDRGALASAWNTVPGESGPPRPEDFSPSSVHQGRTPLSVHDFHLFAQQEFTRWAATMRDTIRTAGSKQLITVGQDEGGAADRLSPVFFGDVLDFTTTHTWWLNDALLWDSLVAKLPGRAMLVQETGLQNDFQIDHTWRRDPQNQAAVLERKMAVALATSAGAIQWLWNVNSYMTSDNEVTIGAVRADGTEKPEVAILHGLAEFAARARDHFVAPESPQVAIVTSQAFQYSPFNWLALEAQKKAVRALHNYCRVPAYVVTENQIAKLGTPRLAILPSPEALSDAAWQALVAYVSNGGRLLVTGSVERDPHWFVTERLRALGVDAHPAPLNFRQGQVQIGDRRIAVSYFEQGWLDWLPFADGATYKEVSVGKGQMFLVSFPAELSEGMDAPAAVYEAVLRKAQVEAPFTVTAGSPGVLIRPLVMRDAVLYLFMSESGQDEDIAVKDKLTGAEMKFRLPAQRARLILLNRKDGKVIGRYGFE